MTASSSTTTTAPALHHYRGRNSWSIRTRRPSARTASLAVVHATANASAIRATVRCPTTSASNAQRSARRESLARGSAARLVSWRHTCQHQVHRQRRTVTSSVVGRQPSGSWLSRRASPCRGRRPRSRSVDTTGPARRPGRRAPRGPARAAARGLPGRARQGRRTPSGQAGEGSVRHVEVFPMGCVRTLILGRARPLPGAPPRRPPLHPHLRRAGLMEARFSGFGRRDGQLLAVVVALAFGGWDVAELGGRRRLLNQSTHSSVRCRRRRGSRRGLGSACPRSASVIASAPQKTRSALPAKTYTTTRPRRLFPPARDHQSPGTDSTEPGTYQIFH